MKSNETQKLSPRQLHVLPYLINTPSYEEAARLSGITSKQIHTWLKQPEFQEELKKQRNIVFCDALANLKIGTQKAVQTLLCLLDDEDPRIRLLASEKILTNAFKGVEFLDIEERLSALEQLTVQTRKP